VAYLTETIFKSTYPVANTDLSLMPSSSISHSMLSMNGTVTQGNTLTDFHVSAISFIRRGNLTWRLPNSQYDLSERKLMPRDLQYNVVSSYNATAYPTASTFNASFPGTETSPFPMLFTSTINSLKKVEERPYAVRTKCCNC
jgi:hypothetical protein